MADRQHVIMFIIPSGSLSCIWWTTHGLGNIRHQSHMFRRHNCFWADPELELSFWQFCCWWWVFVLFLASKEVRTISWLLTWSHFKVINVHEVKAVASERWHFFPFWKPILVYLSFYLPALEPSGLSNCRPFATASSWVPLLSLSPLLRPV